MFLDNLFNGVLNYMSNEEDRKQNKRQYNQSIQQQMYEYDQSLKENQRQYNTNLEFNKSQAQLQQNNWQQNFNQQQFNYENASQIRAADMQKAGLNPLMLAGGAEGSTPVSLGSSVTAPSPTGTPSASVPGATSHTSIASQIRFGLLEHFLEAAERDKDRENAKDIANIQADAQKYSADSSKSASNYSADTSAAIAQIADQTRKAELEENKKQFDWTFERQVNEFKMSFYQKEKMQLIHEDNENTRKLVEISSQNYRSALHEFNSAISNSQSFAISMAQLNLEWEKYKTEKDMKQKELNLKNTQIALDNATRIFQSISGLTGDVCKGFLLGRLRK